MKHAKYLAASILLLLAVTSCQKTFGASCTDSPESLNLLSEGSFRIFCDPNCAAVPAPVKGTDIYTTDSSLCKAAAHAGKTDDFVGGKTKVEILQGQQSYHGSDRRGITSTASGPHQASFHFP